ncbi:MAG: TetR/AcrR family transcriptional regulator [Thermoleophilia bacterium]|nr:TetR/AcrR family transcriptional regulator [Thermoleophilia bacterium]
MASTTRLTADERRKQLIDAAMREFAVRGYDGSSTERIAHAAGISQPYVFRLFGSKKALILAMITSCNDDMYSMFVESAGTLVGEDALHAMGMQYTRWITDEPHRLRAQMQAYLACDDDEIREEVREGFGRLVEFAERVSGAESVKITEFFSHGMLLNVIVAMGLMDAAEPWAIRMIEDCMKDMPGAS